MGGRVGGGGGGGGGSGGSGELNGLTNTAVAPNVIAMHMITAANITLRVRLVLVALSKRNLSGGGSAFGGILRR